jgi:hypothetical protein
MSDFAEKENERTVYVNLEDLPDSLVYKLPEANFTYGPERFGVGEYLNIEYYEQKFERAFPGLLQQFPIPGNTIFERSLMFFLRPGLFFCPPFCCGAVFALIQLNVGKSLINNLRN